MDMMMPGSPETEVIRRRMEEVRCDLDQDVREIVEGARDLRDWRYYVKTYPSVCLGTALAVGYLIVPRRVQIRPHAQTIAAEVAKQNQLLATPKSPVASSARGMLLSVVGKLAVRSILSYVERRAGSLLQPQGVDSRPRNTPHA